MILGIDTTSDWSSIALDDECLVWRGNRSQSKELLPKIEDFLKKNKSSFDDLAGVVVVNGPGSYTGIRIGVSVGNTIGMLKNIPVKGVDGLRAQIISNAQFPVSNKFPMNNEQISKDFVSLISAGGSRVYGCKYQISNSKSQIPNVISNGDYFVGEVGDFLGDIEETPKLGVCTEIIGEVNEEVENWIKSSGFDNFELLNQNDKKGRARGAVKIWKDLSEVANNNVIPMYLREAVRK